MKRVMLTFGGLDSSLDPSKTPSDKSYRNSNADTDKGILQGRSGYTMIATRSGNSSADVGYGIGYGKYSGNEINRIAITSGTVTGGTFTLTIYSQTTAAIAWNATAATIQLACEALSSVDVGDIKVTGGPLYAAALRFEFTGQYAGIDATAITINTGSLTGTGSIVATVTEEVKGGSFEQFIIPVKYSGNSTCNLLKVTSTDGFQTSANATVTSIASGLTASDWFFAQYGRFIYCLNATDGLERVTLGGGNTFATKPKAPVLKPPYLFKYSGHPYDVTLDTGASQTGFANAPTFSFVNGDLNVKLTGTETNASVAITVTCANDPKNFQFRDSGVVIIDRDSDVAIPPESIGVAMVNADATTIDARHHGAGSIIETTNLRQSQRLFHFSSLSRDLRDNVASMKVSFKLSGPSGRNFKIQFFLGDNWLCDTDRLNADGPPRSDRIEYAYSYYKISTDLESDLSPTQTTFAPPLNTNGVYVRLTLSGTKALTTSDFIFVYRKEKLTGKWRRLPNANGTFGVANVTSGTTTYDDHFMEDELEAFPEPGSATGWPPSGSGGITGEALGTWKQSLAVCGNKQCFLSKQGFPNVFIQSPDDEIPLDAITSSDPTRGETSYVSDNRSEPVLGFHGQDSAYALTASANYAKVGDAPSRSSLFRRLPGSRGTLGKRSHTKYGGGILSASQDGLWYYSVGRGFSGEDNGNLSEREETLGVRQSYRRLISNEVVKISLTGATGGACTLTWNSETTGYIAYGAAAIGEETGTGTSTDPYVTVLGALEALTSINPGDVRVYGGPLGQNNIRLEFDGQYFATNVSTVTFNNGTLTGSPSGSVEVETSGGDPSSNASSVYVVEHNDEVIIGLGARYLRKTRNGTWHEGCFSDKIIAAISVRERGMFLLKSTGVLFRADNTEGDNSVSFPWEYETGDLLGPRVRITGVEAQVLGAPLLQIDQDDIAGGSSTVSINLLETKARPIDVNVLPGLKHRLRFMGEGGVDVVKSCTVIYEDMGESYGA